MGHPSVSSFFNTDDIKLEYNASEPVNDRQRWLEQFIHLMGHTRYLFRSRVTACRETGWREAGVTQLDVPESKRGYRHAIDEFIQWYCFEPRLSFNKVVVTRYRIFLENRHLAAGTINGRLAAVRRLAYEAADAGLLSPELAAGIRRVKGAKKLGVRLGNWLTAEEARRLWQSPAPNTLKGKRDRAILAVLLGCGLRRRELAVWTSRICSSVRNIGP
jgi:site-specific recombinase XerD